MELGTTAKRTTGKFRYIQTRIEPEEFQAPRPEASSFFYIGKNYQNIKWLLGQFDSGFCSGDLKSAAAMITKLALKKECMPDMIVMDLNCKEEDIQVFRKSVLQLGSNANCAGFSPDFARVDEPGSQKEAG
jgi:hypothetical protein